MRLTPSPRAAGAAGWLVVAALLLLAAGGAASRPGGWLLGVPHVAALVVTAVAVALVAWRSGVAGGNWPLVLAFPPALLLVGAPTPAPPALAGPALPAPPLPAPGA